MECNQPPRHSYHKFRQYINLFLIAKPHLDVCQQMYGRYEIKGHINIFIDLLSMLFLLYKAVGTIKVDKRKLCLIKINISLSSQVGFCRSFCKKAKIFLFGWSFAWGGVFPQCQICDLAEIGVEVKQQSCERETAKQRLFDLPPPPNSRHILTLNGNTPKNPLEASAGQSYFHIKFLKFSFYRAH